MSKRISARRLLASNILEIRHDRGWSQEELAGKAGLHRTYIGAIEREERNVSIDNIERIARAFRIPVSKLLSQ